MSCVFKLSRDVTGQRKYPCSSTPGRFDMMNPHIIAKMVAVVSQGLKWVSGPARMD